MDTDHYKELAAGYKWTRLKYYLYLGSLLLVNTAMGQTVETIVDKPCGDDMHFYNEHIYSTNYGGNSIRKITLDGTIEEILKGYEKLGAIELDIKGNIYATNYDNGLLVKVDLAERKLDTLLQNLKGPSGITKDKAGNLFINQNAGSIITKFNPKSGKIGPLYEGQPLYWNTAITIDNEDNVYSNNMWTGEIIKVTPNGEHSIIAELPAIMDNQPDLGYMEFVKGQLLVLHQNNDCIYSIDPKTGFYALLAGMEGKEGHVNGKLLDATFDDPIGIVFNKDKNELYVTDGKEGDQRLRVVKLGNNMRYLPDFNKNPIEFESLKKPDEKTVNINFQIKKKTVLTLEVRNNLYEHVHTEVKELPQGKYQEELDISKYEPGIYFINFKTEDFTKTLKVQKT